MRLGHPGVAGLELCGCLFGNGGAGEDDTLDIVDDVENEGGVDGSGKREGGHGGRRRWWGEARE